MNIWFVVAYLVLGVIGFMLIGLVTLYRVTERECGANLDVTLTFEPDKTVETENEPVKDALNDFMGKADEQLKYLAPWKRIGRVVAVILAWPVMIPYALANIDDALDAIDFLDRMNGHFE